jgi:hypothetical protein
VLKDKGLGFANSIGTIFETKDVVGTWLYFLQRFQGTTTIRVNLYAKDEKNTKTATKKHSPLNPICRI